MESILGWFAASAIVAVLIAIFARQRGWGMALAKFGAGPRSVSYRDLGAPCLR